MGAISSEGVGMGSVVKGEGGQWVPRGAGVRGLGIGVLLLSVALVPTLVGCGEEGPPPPGRGLELPGLPAPLDSSTLVYTLGLTFTRDEAPVQVTRQVPIPMRPGVDPRQDVLRAALEALTAGPLPEERDQGIHSFFGEHSTTLLKDLTVRGDTVWIDFGDLRAAVPNASSSTGSFHFLAELNGTVFAVPGVEVVEYRMEGSCEAFWNFLQRDCQRVHRPGSA
jgi:hypothetical protein